MAVPFQKIYRKKSLLALFCSIFVASLYQYFLTYGNLSDYLLSYKRQTFIDKNKEGLFSSIGYLSMFLAGEAICLRLNEILDSATK